MELNDGARSSLETHAERRRAAHEQVTALWVAAFFDELSRWGVRDVVVSPGSRSTALAMAAFELSQRRPHDLRLYVDVDERGAAFFALGLAKASGRPAVCLCTSGTALANYYPAVLEAETSRVPLVVLSGDRPPQLQGLGAPQTTDQLKAYGDHVRAFRAMPLPSACERDLAFVRQAAREACLAATGGHADYASDGCLRGEAGAGALVRGCGRGERLGSDALMRAHNGESGEALGQAYGEAFGQAQGESHVEVRENADDDAAAQVASRGCAHRAGPVHVNFPFDEPLKPDFAAADAWACAQGVSDAFAVGRRADVGMPLAGSCAVLDAAGIAAAERVLRGRRALVLAGEGTCSTLAEAREVVAWARRLSLPLLADPLSGLRSFDAPEVIDNYDNICRQLDCPTPEVVIRFGRYPVSKHASAMVGKAACSVVVDVTQTRDFNFSTDLFAALTPLEFVRSSWTGEANDAGGQNEEGGPGGEGRPGEASVPGRPDELDKAIGLGEATRRDASSEASALDEAISAGETSEPGEASVSGEVQRDFLAEWVKRNNVEARRIGSIADAERSDEADGLEGAYVRTLLELAPARSCVFSANSMAVRALDTFFVKGSKPLCVLCNRGQNGIDGTVSTALGAAQHFAQTTFLTGDFTLLHDLSALAMQRELQRHHASEGRSTVIVLLNNNGGAIFDMLPQASDDPYFERLFLVPQDVHFEDAARAFGVPYRRACSVEAFAEAYQGFLGMPGISLIEVRLPLRGVRERYVRFQGA